MGNNCCSANEKEKPSLFSPASSPNSSTIQTSNSNATPITSNNSPHSSSLNLFNNKGNLIPGITNTGTGTSNATSNDSLNNNNNNNNNNNSNKTAQQILIDQQITKDHEERQRALAEEQHRLEEIVVTLGRDMVPLTAQNGSVNSSLNSLNGGSVGSNAPYYGFGGNMNMNSMGMNMNMNMNMMGMNMGMGNASYDPGYTNVFMADILNEVLQLQISKDHYQNCILESNTIVIPDTSVANGREAIEVLSSQLQQSSQQHHHHSHSQQHHPQSQSQLHLQQQKVPVLKATMEDMAETFLNHVFCTKEGLIKDVGPIVENVLSATD